MYYNLDINISKIEYTGEIKMANKRKMTKKLEKQFQNKKKLTITIAVSVLVAVILIGSGYLYSEISTTNTGNQTIAASDKPAADHLKNLAIQALIDKKYTQSEALYETAMRQYQYIVDNTTDTATHDTAQASVIDCSAQIWLIEHTLTQP
jgi:hypothetical protein